MAVATLNDLFIHGLSDIYSAEKQLTKALPRLARAATNPELSAAFKNSPGRDAGTGGADRPSSRKYWRQA